MNRNLNNDLLQALSTAAGPRGISLVSTRSVTAVRYDYLAMQQAFLGPVPEPVA